MFNSLWKIQKIRKIRFSRFPRISGIFGISGNFLPKNVMFRQKPEDMSKTIYLAPQNREQNVKIRSRTLWKSFQLECTICTIILCPDLYDDVTKNVRNPPPPPPVVRSPKKPSLNRVNGYISIVKL